MVLSGLPSSRLFRFEVRQPMVSKTLEPTERQDEDLAGKLPHRGSIRSPALKLTVYRKAPPLRTTAYHGRQRSRSHLQVGGARRSRPLARKLVHVRCQGWYPRHHLRPSVWCSRIRHERRHPLPDSLVAKKHHLRRSHKAPQHLDNHWLQGFADG